MRLERLLVTTDLSHAARASFPHAVGLAKRFDASVVLLHVDETPAFGLGSTGEVTAYLDRISQVRQRRIAEDLQFIRDCGVSADVQMREGTASEQILAAADELSADMIVASKQGAGRLERILLGSTTTRLLRRGRLPTLIVPVSPMLAASVTYRRLVVPTDFSDASQAALAAAVSLAKTVEARVQLTHVLRLPVPVPTIPGEVAIAAPPEFHRGREIDASRMLQQTADEWPQGTVDPRLLLGTSVSQALAEEADDDQSLLVIASQGKGAIRSAILGSTSEEVIRLTRCPVLVLPSAAFVEA